MKNQAMVFFSFLLLTLTCISCSHSGQVTSENGVIGEESAEGSSSSNEADVSKDAEERAKAMMEGGDSTLTAEAKSTENPLTLGMEGDPVGAALVAAREASSEAPTLLTAPTEASEESATEPSNKEKSSTKSEKNATVPHSEKREPTQKSSIESKEHGEEVARAESDELDEAAPIPVAEDSKQEPALASAQISGFIERHAFLVTIGVVGFVFALFIMMRRNKGSGDHLTL